MATKVTRTVGATGCDYTTLAAALAAMPANLVTADEQWDILLKNEEHTYTTQIDFGSITTDSTRYIHITAQNGAWCDNTTNPLRFGYGPRITWTAGGDSSSTFNGHLRLGSYNRLSKLQLRRNAFGGSVVSLVDATDYCTIDRCFFGRDSTGSNSFAGVALQRDGNVLVNSVVTASVNCSSGGVIGVVGRVSTAALVAANTVANCTFIKTADLGAQGDAINFDGRNNALIATDCVVLGPWSNTVNSNSRTWAAGCGRIVTSLADGTGNYVVPGTGNTFSVTAANQIENLSNGTNLDAKLKSGFTSYTGQRNQAYTADLDIYGTARSTSAPQIGAQESIPSGGSSINLQQVERGRGVLRGLGRGL